MLGTLYDQCTDEPSRTLIITALTQYDTTPAVEELARIAQGTSDLRRRRRAMMGLRASGQERAKQLLSQIVVK